MHKNVMVNGKKWVKCDEDTFMPMDSRVGGCNIAKDSKYPVVIFYYPDRCLITFTNDIFYGDSCVVHFECNSFTEAEFLISKVIKAA